MSPPLRLLLLLWVCRQVGKVDTRHLNVGLQVKSVLDSMDASFFAEAPQPELDCISESNRGTTEVTGSAAGQVGWWVQG